MKRNNLFIISIFLLPSICAMEKTETSSFVFFPSDKSEPLDDCQALALESCKRIYGKTVPTIEKDIEKKFKKIRTYLQSSKNSYHFYKIFKGQQLAGYFSFFLNKTKQHECVIDILNMNKEYNPQLSQDALKFLKNHFTLTRIYILARKNPQNERFIETLHFKKCNYLRTGHSKKEWQGYFQDVAV